MSLKPRNIDFQETWANLRETVAGVVALRSVERAVWNTRFSDVYALCVAHPEPLAARLYDETRRFLEEHVEALRERVRGDCDPAGSDPRDGLLERYVTAWKQYSQGVGYLNSLYCYLNLQHVKRQKRVSEAEVLYGSAAAAGGDARQLEVGELGLAIWERVLLHALAPALTARIVTALDLAREQRLDGPLGEALREAVRSTAAVRTARPRQHTLLYEQLVLQPYLARAAEVHAAAAAALLGTGDVSHYMQQVLAGLAREEALGARYLLPASGGAVRACYERAAVAAHVGALHAELPSLLRACASPDASPERRADLRRLHALLRPLGGEALRPLVSAAHDQAAADGRALLDAPVPPNEAHTHFVHAVLQLHDKYSALFTEVFGGAQAFSGALDKACSAVVNAPRPARAPELLARYCDALLRRKGGGGGGGGGGAGAEGDADAALARAITVFKYIDDKDVFQKYYARALARRLIHQLSASMDQEEAMINRLKAACGYEFTNKLHRMFTDVAVSADLDSKFQRYLQERRLPASPAFSVQVLQAGAWPLGGAGPGGGGGGAAAAAAAAAAPPAALERSARLFEAFYRDAFSGRRLAWLAHLCGGELRARHTPRLLHLHASAHQCGVLLAFDAHDEQPSRELQAALRITGDTWRRQLRPLLEAGLLLAEGEVEEENCEGTLRLNLNFVSKRSRLRLAAAGGPGGAGQLRGRPQAVPAGGARADHEAAEGAAAQRAAAGGGGAGARAVRAVRRDDQEVYRGAHRQAVPGARARPPRHLLLPRLGRPTARPPYRPTALPPYRHTALHTPLLESLQTVTDSRCH